MRFQRTGSSSHKPEDHRDHPINSKSGPVNSSQPPISRSIQIYTCSRQHEALTPLVPSLTASARVDRIRQCIVQLNADPNRVVELNGPQFTTQRDVCIIREPGDAYSLVKIISRTTGLVKATNRDIACAAQERVDACATGNFVAGRSLVCNGEDISGMVSGAHNGG
ncbi:uncharacterized protein GGS25DRAFT_479474 [Hypoxylon fragiforme]|uniref:uncharacterized protein n=1 Tax=Hypoxylon fragiforme TaxID=63214 RepID=UPI0020C6E6AD|nr:uncharacterized protein GGS25DRAFT_479474 [Hypoxylon fragiforme]KAI2610707.1 hypothetical protein GGS25DRAFT_479474 [Hypoxylon fragiforme]